MRRAGLVVWGAHQVTAALVKPGITTADIDRAIEEHFAKDRLKNMDEHRTEMKKMTGKMVSVKLDEKEVAVLQAQAAAQAAAAAAAAAAIASQPAVAPPVVAEA